MFEKDAKKWVKENTRIEHSASFGEKKVYPSAENGFQAGAEFGYNKANEWHYVKDGDFPTDVTEKPYLVALKSEYTNDFLFETDIWCRSFHCFASFNPKNVYAWKEIVLPKEIE